MSRNRRKGANISDATMRMGRTIVGEREKTQSDSERIMKHRKDKIRTNLTVAVAAAGMILILVIIGMTFRNIFGVGSSGKNSQEQSFEPAIKIEDESASGYATERMRDYVGKIERDLSELGLRATKAIIPAGKMREIDIYIDGRKEYYKCNLDRGTAVTAEDISRMVKYLKKKKVSPSYVDVRIEEKAYYK